MAVILNLSEFRHSRECRAKEKIIFNLTDCEISDDLKDLGVIELDQDIIDAIFERVNDATFSEVNKSIMKETLANSVARLVAAQIKRLALAEGKVLLGQQWPWLNSTLEKEFAALGIGVGYPFYRDIGDEYTLFKGIVWV